MTFCWISCTWNQSPRRFPWTIRTQLRRSWPVNSRSWYSRVTNMCWSSFTPRSVSLASSHWLNWNNSHFVWILRRCWLGRWIWWKIRYKFYINFIRFQDWDWERCHSSSCGYQERRPIQWISRARSTSIQYSNFCRVMCLINYNSDLDVVFILVRGQCSGSQQSTNHRDIDCAHRDRRFRSTGVQHALYVLRQTDWERWGLGYSHTVGLVESENRRSGPTLRRIGVHWRRHQDLRQWHSARVQLQQVHGRCQLLDDEG